MSAIPITKPNSRVSSFWPTHPVAILGILIGLVMPVISALIFPTYTHMMTTPQLEWTRLIEAPFAISETAVIGWALYCGLEPTRMIQALPRHVKVALGLLVAGLFVSSITMSGRPTDSITISFIYLIHLLFFCAVAHLSRSATRDDHMVFINLLGAGLIILAIWTAVRFVFPPNPSSVSGGVIVWPASLPGFINVRHFGSWTGAVCAAFLVVVLNEPKRRALSWPHFFYFVAASMTIWSGTRAAILALAGAVVIIIAMNRKLPTLRAANTVAMLTGAALATAWVLIPYNQPEFQLFARAGNIYQSGDFASGRFELWEATFDRWLDSPWFGWGSGSTFWEVFVGWSHTQPHNAILLFLISWGVVGASGALWLLGCAIVSAHRQTMKHSELQPLLAVLYVLLIMSLLEGMLHYPRFIMLIMTLFAFITTYRQPRLIDAAAH